VLHAKALPGNPYDGHTLAQVIEETQALTGREVERVYVDKGYRGHTAAGYNFRLILAWLRLLLRLLIEIIAATLNPLPRLKAAS